MNFDFRKGLASFSESVSEMGSSLQQNIQPFAQRTRQQLTEKLVGSDEVTSLPVEYIELEKQYDEIYPANQSLLSILSIYETEGYDLPPRLRDSLQSAYRGMQDRLAGVQQAGSVHDAGKILISGTPEAAAAAAQEKKSLHHALGRALEGLSATLVGPGKEHVSPVLRDVGYAETAIGDMQKEQDAEVTKVSQALRNLLTQTQGAISKARKEVHNMRLDLDIRKSHLRHAAPDAPNLASLEREVERAEDDFVAAIQESSTLMQSAIATMSYKPVQASVQLVKAQREYHRRAAQHLDELLPELEKKEAEAKDVAAAKE